MVDAQVHAVRYAAIQIARGYARRPRGDPSGRCWARRRSRWLAPGWLVGCRHSAACVAGWSGFTHAS